MREWFRRRRYPPIWLIAAATVGACLLLIVALFRWPYPQDEHAYWLAGQRVLAGQSPYDPTASSIEPYVYWYPPPLAQLMAPLSAVVPSALFSWLWTGLLLACLWWMAGRRLLVGLAFVAFLPVAVELWFRNIWIPLAAISSLAIVRWPWMFAIGAHLKLAPGIGIVYLVAGRRWRDAALAIGVGLAVLAVSYALSPELWREFIEVALGRGAGDVSGLVPLPYAARLAAGLVLAAVAGLLQPRVGEPLVVVAIIVAAPTLWLSAFAMAVAIVPVVAARRARSPQ